MKNFFSMFAGVEGFGLGIGELGQCVGFSEIDKYSSAVLKHHFPNTTNYGDCSTIQWNNVPNFDLLCGGSPCQDFSIAGKRKGLAGTKSSLAWEYIRCLRDKQPTYFIWENVKGVMSSRGGWDFANLLTAFSESGYSLWWQVLNAKDFGVPQSRERIFVVGSRNGSLPEIQFERSSDQGDDSSSCEPKEVSACLTTSSGRQDPTAQTYVANTLTTRQSPPSRTQRREKENYIATALSTRSGGNHVEDTYVATAIHAKRV